MSVRKKIDISAATAAKLTSQGNDSDLAYLKANGPRALPKNPTANKWDASSIMKQFYKQPEILFAWLKAMGDALETLGINVDDYLDTNDGLVVHLAGDETITGKKTFKDKVIINAQGSGNNGELDLYYAYIVTNSKDYFAKAGATSATASIYKLPYSADSATYTIATTDMIDEVWAEEATHHHLKTDSEGYVYEELPEEDSADTSGNRIMNHADGVALANEVKLLKEAVAAIIGIKTYEQGLIEKIMQGTLTAGYASRADRASHDGEGNLIDVTQYGNSVALSYEQSTGKLTVKLYNKAGTQIDSKVIDLPSELVFTDQYYDSENKKLVFVPASGGSNIEISLSDLVDTYTGAAGSDGICTVSINDHVITVTVADGSISMAKLSSTLQSTWNGWASAEADRVLVEQGRVSAEAQRVLNENARLAMPHLDIDNQGYLIINYGSSRDITID